MTPQDKRLFLAKEWFLKAQDDESAVNIIIKEGVAPSTACFLSQQIAEKVLKGFLIFHKNQFPKTHLLDELLKLCKEIDPEFIDLEVEARDLSDFYISTRYPGDFPNFSQKDAREAFRQAQKIKDFVLKKIGV